MNSGTLCLLSAGITDLYPTSNFEYCYILNYLYHKPLMEISQKKQSGTPGCICNIRVPTPTDYFIFLVEMKAQCGTLEAWASVARLASYLLPSSCLASVTQVLGYRQVPLCLQVLTGNSYSRKIIEHNSKMNIHEPTIQMRGRPSLF